MSLKRKTEVAFKTLISAVGIGYTGNVYLGQEGLDGETGTRDGRYTFVNAQERGDACLAGDGSTLGLKRMLVVVGVATPADFDPQATPPEADSETTHSADVNKITDALQIDTLHTDLAATQSDFGVVAATPVDPPEPEPNARHFVTYFAWEVICCETDI